MKRFNLKVLEGVDGLHKEKLRGEEEFGAVMEIFAKHRPHRKIKVGRWNQRRNKTIYAGCIVWAKVFSTDSKGRSHHRQIWLETNHKTTGMIETQEAKAIEDCGIKKGCLIKFKPGLCDSEYFPQKTKKKLFKLTTVS